MKKILITVALTIALAMQASAQNLVPRYAETSISDASAAVNKTQVEWLSMDVASQLKDNKKLFFVDFFTTWCGWCKRMDKDVFTNATIVKLLNKYYVPVKFNAEGNTEFTWRGTRYMGTPTPRGGRPQAHSFAKAVLGQQLGYPSFGVFDANGNLITVIQGYQPVDEMTVMLWYIASGDHRRYAYEKYKSVFDKEIRPKMETALKQE